MDGTIYLGDQVFPQTLPFLKSIEESGRKYVFFTNNSSKNANNYIEKLHNMGIEVKKEQMLISTHVLIDFLLKTRKDKTAFVVGTNELKYELEENSINLGGEDADYVILGFDTSLNYDKLVTACNLIREGKPYFGVNPDFNCPTPTGFIPDCGAMAALIKASTGVECEFFGKPSYRTLEYIKTALKCDESEIAVVGDRLYTDIALTKNSNATGVLVLSGEATQADVEKSEIKPDFIFNDISDITKYL